MTELEKAARQALEALDFAWGYGSQKVDDKLTEAITALRRALEQQPAPLSLEESLSVAKVCCGDYANCHAPCTPRGRWQAQQGPAAQWVGLTQDDMNALVEQARNVPACNPCPDYNTRLLTLANNKLREKNGGKA